MANTRNIALNVLLKIENEGAYSNIALNNAIKENRLSGVDSSFVSALVYGVLEEESRLIILSGLILNSVKKLK
mgnify:CR=1 FL=1